MLSAGLHGVEGFFGSAVQIATLRSGLFREWKRSSIGILLIHALNPHGFAWVRRGDEANIDPNRNFLLPGQDYAGCSASYRKLNELLNPRTPPAQMDWFGPRMLSALLSLGRLPLVQGVSFSGVATMIAISGNGGIPAVLGAVIAASLPA